MRIRATSLNGGFDRLMLERPPDRGRDIAGGIPLADGAGEVVAVGDGVTRFKMGRARSFRRGWTATVAASGQLSAVFVGSRTNFESLVAFVERHDVHPVIDRVFGFEQAPAAFEHMAHGDYMGKIAIRVNSISYLIFCKLQLKRVDSAPARSSHR